MASDEQLQDWRDRALRVEQEVGKAIIGQHDTLRLINVALFARGHVLLEGDVGVGKTTILRAFSRHRRRFRARRRHRRPDAGRPHLSHLRRR